MKPATLSGIQIPLRWAGSGLEQQKCEGSILGCSGDFSRRVQGLERRGQEGTGEEGRGGKVRRGEARRGKKTLEAREKETFFKDTATFSKEVVQIVFPF